MEGNERGLCISSSVGRLGMPACTKTTTTIDRWLRSSRAGSSLSFRNGTSSGLIDPSCCAGEIGVQREGERLKGECTAKCIHGGRGVNENICSKYTDLFSEPQLERKDGRNASS